MRVFLFIVFFVFCHVRLEHRAAGVVHSAALSHEIEIDDP